MSGKTYYKSAATVHIEAKAWIRNLAGIYDVCHSSLLRIMLVNALQDGIDLSGVESPMPCETYRAPLPFRIPESLVESIGGKAQAREAIRYVLNNAMASEKTQLHLPFAA